MQIKVDTTVNFLKHRSTKRLIISIELSSRKRSRLRHSQPKQTQIDDSDWFQTRRFASRRAINSQPRTTTRFLLSLPHNVYNHRAGDWESEVDVVEMVKCGRRFSSLSPACKHPPNGRVSKRKSFFDFIHNFILLRAANWHEWHVHDGPIVRWREKWCELTWLECDEILNNCWRL